LIQTAADGETNAHGLMPTSGPDVTKFIRKLYKKRITSVINSDKNDDLRLR